MNLLRRKSPRRQARPAARHHDDGTTVLIVEDDSGLRDLIRRTLDESGYRTVVARHGSEAVGEARAHGKRIDLVIAGVLLSAAGASLAADVIRAERPGVPVVFVSGSVKAVTGHQARDVGAVYIGRPYGAHALLHRVKWVLSEH
jgi:DNA-binding response OmpR family regulator